MDAKERGEVVSLALEHLSGVIGASGKAEELVRLTTQIVQAAKRLVEGTPEDMKSKSTTVLAEFVIAAKAIAKDARAVDSSSLQKLSSTKRAVEMLVKELDEWHISQNPSNGKDDIEVALEELGSHSRSSPPNTPASEAEKKLLWELKRLQKELARKKEPQTSPKQHGQPEDALKMAVSGLTRSANELVETAGQKNPTKESLLEPCILLSKMVSTLMDLVDSLFVTKYPMRSQVHMFSSTLVENVIAYKEQSKTDDVSTLKILSTQTPALLSAVEVMVEQCYLRSQNVRENQQMSIARNVALQEDLRPGRSPAGSPAPKRKKEVEKKPSEEAEICCMICTSVAVDQKTKEMMPKGSELTLKVLPSSTVNDIRKLLSGRIGLPLDQIEIKFQGDEALSDDTKITPNSPIPYFVFNLNEPSEEEVRELRKNERRKNRIKIEDVNWSKATNPIAVALFDYEALGEDGNLTFDEGDILEITEKSADGWWTGVLDGKTGVFPASFVEELQQPKTKEEERRLVRRLKQRVHGEQTQTETIRIDDIPVERRASNPTHLHLAGSFSNPPRSASPKPGFKALKTPPSHTDVSPKSSPSPTKKAPKLERVVSEPSFSQFEQQREMKGSKGGKKLSLFKKKAGNYAPIIEEGRGRDRERLIASDIYPKPRSPILSSPARRKDIKPDFEWEETSSSGPAVNGVPVAPHPSRKPLVRPVSSPKLIPKGVETGSGSSTRPASDIVSGPKSAASPSLRPRRPPPPVPKPYASHFGRTGMTELLHRQLSNESDEDKREQLSRVLSPPLVMKPVSESPPCITISPEPLLEAEASVQARREEENALAPPPSDIVKGSSSMEELFKNLEEFDLLNGGEMNELDVKGEGGSRDYATIPRSELPQEKKEVEVKQEEEEEEEEEEEVKEEEVKEEEEEKEEVKEDSVRETPKMNDSGVYDVLIPQPAASISETEREPKSSPLGSPPLTQSETKPNIPIKPRSVASKPVTFSKPKPPPKKPGIVSKKAPSPPLPCPVQNGLDREKKSMSPQPVPPPRMKRKHLSHKMMDRMQQYEREAEEKQQEEERKSDQKMSPAPSRHSPVPPPKPPTDRRPAKASKVKSRLEVLEKSGQCASAPVSRTASPDEAKLSREGSVSTENMGSNPHHPGGSPVVMRRTNTVVSSNTSKPHISDIDQDDCTGIGKEGILHKEGTSSRDWKARYFKLQENQIVYFGSDSFSGDSKPLGQIPVRRMLRAVPIGEKNGFQSFAINMRYDTSVVLGSHTKTEMDDWVKSINMMIKTMKSNGGRTSSYGPAYKTAIKCITYLSDGDHPAEDRIFMGVRGESEKVKNWLHTIDRGEDADLSDMPDAITAVGLLKELFREGRIGCLVQHDLAKDLCELVKSTSPVSVLGTRLEEIPSDSRGMLKQLLRLFEQVIEHSDKNHTGVADLNRVFGPLIFEKILPSQLEPLLAYLISTCELIIS